MTRRRRSFDWMPMTALESRMRRLCESYLSGNIQITLSSELIRIPRHRRLGLDAFRTPGRRRSEEHTSELQSLMRISYAVFCLKKKKIQHNIRHTVQRKYQSSR